MCFLAVPVWFGVGVDDNKQPFKEVTPAFPGRWACHYQDANQRHLALVHAMWSVPVTEHPGGGGRCHQAPVWVREAQTVTIPFCKGVRG